MTYEFLSPATKEAPRLPIDTFAYEWDPYLQIYASFEDVLAVSNPRLGLRHFQLRTFCCLLEAVAPP